MLNSDTPSWQPGPNRGPDAGAGLRQTLLQADDRPSKPASQADIAATKPAFHAEGAVTKPALRAEGSATRPALQAEGSATKPALGAGVGLRQPHYQRLLAAAPPLAFVEVHSENFFADGGAALDVLHAARERWPVSLHGVGLALGSAVGLDEWHLQRLARLVDRIEPLRVSDHACFARAPRRSGQPPLHASDLLPIAFNEASLAIMVANVQRVQERLRRPILVENLSAYLRWADDGINEPDFFNQLARRSGCGVLLDVNNLVVNALNEGARSDADAVAAACAWVDRIDAAAVGEIHLAGYFEAGDIVIDDHGSRVREPVWAVYRHAVRRLGARPTLVEWDTDLPAPEVLLAEAARAEDVLAGRSCLAVC